MSIRRAIACLAAGILMTGSLVACGNSAADAKTLTYWASNQGESLEFDQKTLQPELDKFEQETGIHVKLEVVPWSDLLDRLMAAAQDDNGPDVVNIGNTWSASLRAAGAFVAFDGQMTELSQSIPSRGDPSRAGSVRTPPGLHLGRRHRGLPDRGRRR